VIKQYYYKLKDIPIQNIGSGNEKDQIEIETWLAKNTDSVTKALDVRILKDGKVTVSKIDCSVVSVDMKYESEKETVSSGIISARIG
jgi:hypothetical protein